MKMNSLIILSSIIFSQSACATSHGYQGTKTLDKNEHGLITQELKQAVNSPNRVRIITDDNHEVPDPTRPLLLEQPDGKHKWVIGFSGQNIMVLDSLKELVYGGIKKTRKVEIINKFGFKYGGEIDPATGKPIGYSDDSSTWDVSVFRYKKDNGTTGLKLLAGAMGTGSDGKPFLIKDGFNNTRQRLFFDAEFKEMDKRKNEYTIFANNPKAILNSGEPVDGNWIQKNSRGEIIFSHGYGGEPVTLANGDLFVDHRGWVPFVHETVVEQREEEGRKIPYRTAIVVTYLDKTLSQVMQPTKIIFDVFKKDGKIWKAAERPTAGPLVEGAHIEIFHQGKPVKSMAQVRALTQKGMELEYQLLFSAGEYFGHYGSYMAYSKGNLESFEPVLDDQGELLDLTAPLRVLFTWIGRPVNFHVDGKEYLMIHGVDRNSLPAGFVLDQIPKHHEWPHFKRQEIVVPVERVLEKGLPRLKIIDESGLIERLKKYVPRKVSFIDFPLNFQTAALETASATV